VRAPFVVADLAGGHEETDGAALPVGHGMQLCVHAAVLEKTIPRNVF
jgi:hypothetical protein